MKEKRVLSRLLAYAGGRRWLTLAGTALAALGQLLALMPFVCIWMILRDVLEADYSRIAGYGWMAVGLAVGAIVVYLAGLMCTHAAAFRVATNMRKAMMRHVMSLPIGFLAHLGSGRVRKWVQESAGQTETYLAHHLPDKAGMFATVAGLAALMFGFDWRMGLLCLMTVALAMAVMMLWMTGPTLRSKMGEYQASLDAMSAEAVEYVRGMPVVKTFGRSVHSFGRFKAAIEAYRRWVIAYTLQLRLPMTLYTVLVNASFAVLVGATLVAAGGGRPSHEFMLNLLYYIIITPAIATTLNRIMFASESEMMVGDALGKVEGLLAMQPLAEPQHPVVPVGNDLRLCGVGFRYPGAEHDAVEGISMAIPAGSKVALVGASGSGKTTLASLIARFFDVGTGSITLGGADLRQIGHAELMRRVSFVFQDSHLLKASILENVRLGRPTASRQEVLAALHLAQCDDILAKLPLGIDTVIGSRGTHLSGGEQQRIAIARVLLQDTPVIVLDEATAYADADNEVRIRRAFDALAQSGKTLIMIAHRLSSVTNADCIYVMDRGRIAEQGTHQGLLEQKGLYFKAWNQYTQSINWRIK